MASSPALQSSQLSMPVVAPHRPAIKVVAVDDDDYFREMLATELDAHGFAIDVFPDGRSLLPTSAMEKRETQKSRCL